MRTSGMVRLSALISGGGAAAQVSASVQVSHLRSGEAGNAVLQVPAAVQASHLVSSCGWR